MLTEALHNTPEQHTLFVLEETLQFLDDIQKNTRISKRTITKVKISDFNYFGIRLTPLQSYQHNSYQK